MLSEADPFLQLGFNLLPKESDEFWIAAFEFVRNVQGDDPIVPRAFLELLSDLLAMMRLHGKDRVSGLHEFFRQNARRCAVRTC